MMNQILQEEQRKYLCGVGKIGKTHEILDQLELKMAGYHERKRTEEQLLESREEPPQQPTKTKSTFKLFSKPQSQTNTQKMDLNDLELEASKGKSEGQVGQLLQEVEAIQQLVRKKLALKEERVGQLERQVKLAGEEKVHLYKINCQLEEELAFVNQQAEGMAKKFKCEEEELEAELKTLTQIFQNKKNENKSLRKDEQLLKETLKETQARRKTYHESEIKVMRHQSKSKIVSRQTEPVEQEQYLRALVGELDKLRRMVKQKMKKSSSKGKIR